MSELLELHQRVAELEAMDTKRQWGKEALPEYPERLQERAIDRDTMSKRILIVEDSLTQAAQLKDMLQEYSYLVTVATDGEVALAVARERKPDLIISGVAVPGMDGYEMCREIKQDEALKDVPVMLVTVLEDTKDIIRALKAKVDYYLTKPYYEDHLLSRVESAFSEPVRQRNGGTENGLEIAFGGERHLITSGRRQMLNLLLSTYDNAVHQNQELIKTQRELQEINEKLQQEVLDRKQAEMEIRRLKDFNEGIVQNMAEGIAVEDAEGRIMFINPAAATLLGYSPEELLGQHWSVIVPPDQHPSVRAASERHLHGEIDRYELQLVRKDGTQVPVLVSGSPLIEEGRFAGTLSVFTDITAHKRVEKELHQNIERLRATFVEAILALASAIKIKDPYTARQQRRVAQLAVAIAREMGLSEEQVEGTRMAANVYDIGMMNVPAEFLSDPEGLNELEYGIIKAHPQVGCQILKAVQFPWPVAEIVLQHHERLDGSGYPEGLLGEEIMLEARILAVADVVAAMASHQPYRSALGIDRALEEISQNRGTLYDPGVVGACLKLFKQKEFRFEHEVGNRDKLGWLPNEVHHN